jgi:hypothetical protein
VTTEELARRLGRERSDLHKRAIGAYKRLHSDRSTVSDDAWCAAWREVLS